MQGTFIKGENFHTLIVVYTDRELRSSLQAVYDRVELPDFLSIDRLVRLLSSVPMCQYISVEWPRNSTGR